MSAAPRLPLRGRVVLVTRPAHQAGPLCRAIEALGGEALLLPALSIVPLPDAERRVAAALDAGVDVAVFTSANAARIAWPAMAAVSPPGIIASVGEGTSAALRQAGCDHPVRVAAGTADSEGLLALPELSRVEARHVVIFTGEGGRALLGDALRARGARVTVVSVYRRALPPMPDPSLLARLRTGALDAVIASSAEGVRNLALLLPGDILSRLARLPHAVAHPRIARAIEAAGARTVLVAAGGDAALAAALAGHFEAAAAGAAP